MMKQGMTCLHRTGDLGTAWFMRENAFPRWGPGEVWGDSWESRGIDLWNVKLETSTWLVSDSWDWLGHSLFPHYREAEGSVVTPCGKRTARRRLDSNPRCARSQTFLLVSFSSSTKREGWVASAFPKPIHSPLAGIHNHTCIPPFGHLRGSEAHYRLGMFCIKKITSLLTLFSELIWPWNSPCAPSFPSLNLTSISLSPDVSRNPFV